MSHDSLLKTPTGGQILSTTEAHILMEDTATGRRHTAFTIPGLWAPTCRCFRVNIDGNVSAPPPLLSGSLAPGTDCRIRCVSERLDAAEVSRTTAAAGTRVSLQVTGSTGFRSAGLGLPPRGDVLVRLCLQTEQAVSLVTSEQVPAQDTFTPHTYRTHELLSLHPAVQFTVQMCKIPNTMNYIQHKLSKSYVLKMNETFLNQMSLE